MSGSGFSDAARAVAKVALAAERDLVGRDGMPDCGFPDAKAARDVARATIKASLAKQRELDIVHRQVADVSEQIEKRLKFLRQPGVPGCGHGAALVFRHARKRVRHAGKVRLDAANRRYDELLQRDQPVLNITVHAQSPGSGDHSGHADACESATAPQSPHRLSEAPE